VIVWLLAMAAIVAVWSPLFWALVVRDPAVPAPVFAPLPRRVVAVISP
jgi:hypothetical protein